MAAAFAGVYRWIIVILLFSLAIFIHELGHFLFARWLGLKVDAFAIGFGPALWKKKIGGILYKVGCIPFGGYVALPQLDPSGMQQIQGKDGENSGEKPKEEKLPDISAWKRMVVAFAGPLGNVALGVVLAVAIWLAPGARTGVTDTEIGAVWTDSPAYAKGLRTGDRITAVNGTKVATWSDLRIESMLVGDAPAALFDIVKPDGKTLQLELPLATNNIFGVKMLDGVMPKSSCAVTNVMPDSPAQNAGLLPGDILAKLNGATIGGSLDFILSVERNGTNELELVWNRKEKELSAKITPVFDEKLGRAVIGVALSSPEENVPTWMMYRSAWDQLSHDCLSVARILKALVAPKAKGERKTVASNIGGPVTIVAGLYRSVKGSMWDALGFLRMICMNLAILNLLPLPVLDGGHILFALYEMIRRKKPNPKFVALVTNAFAFLLIGLMLVLVYRDFVLQSKLHRATKTPVQSQQENAEAK